MSGKITPEDIVEFERLNERLVACSMAPVDHRRVVMLSWGSGRNGKPSWHKAFEAFRKAQAEREAQLPAVITSGRER